VSTNIKILNTIGLNKAIRDMITNEKNCLLLLTPYIDLDDDIKNKLTFSKAKKIHIVYRKKEELNDNEDDDKDDYKKQKKKEYDRHKEKMDKLKRHFENEKKIDFFEIDDLHAKVYLSSSKIILTSMNLTNHSQKYNFELGVIIDAYKNDKICEDIVGEIKTFLNNNGLNDSKDLLDDLYANHWIVSDK